MPVVIDQDTINIRVVWLEMEREKLRQKQAGADDEKMAEMARAIDACNAKLEELDDWLRILNQDPGWGELINIGGRQIPRLPTFKSEEELKYRLENPDKTWREGAPDLNYEETARAREYNARSNAEDSVRYMDGNGPFTKLEELGLGEEDIVETIDKLGGNIGCPNQKLEAAPPSSEGS